ncbi:beta-1,4-galactosyltransferase galt-1-like isoform X1 [Hoplias malabaricus]|uniref:beta-1,4-galactosyltransferase galt-1-like isoform X1 n=2 Tax=Hoplias malabaricus TaxID=27720 RepID=UPI003462FE57
MVPRTTGQWLKMKTDILKVILLVLMLMGITVILVPKLRAQPEMHSPSEKEQTRIRGDEKSITPIKHTKHFMVSAFIDHRFKNTIRVISIMKRDSLQPLYCICCTDNICQTAEAEVQINSDHFGFAFGASDVLCKVEDIQNAAHVAISTTANISDVYNMDFLPIKNRVEHETFRFNFTVCVSSLFGAYNNVLQFAQSMEMYKLLGVQHVVIYNTSCGPDLEKLLQHYRREGILEVVPWPIDQFLTPSTGWNSKRHSGELQYYGQLVTLNECIYRNMYQSRYVLLNDIDEIFMPKKHANLSLLMETLQPKHRNVGVFIIENQIFPKTVFEETGHFKRPEWKNIPGVNILEHIYKEPDRTRILNPAKMIVDPRSVVQTSVHHPLQTLEDIYRVPVNVCYGVHVRAAQQRGLTKDQLLVDKRVWDFEKELVTNVNQALKSSGFLNVSDCNF